MVGAMERVVEPELLDSLAADDPRAVHSRHDLRRINQWMGNSRHLCAAMKALTTPPRRILEIGAGDGTLMLKIARAFADPWKPGIELLLLDMDPVISPETLAEYGKLRWTATTIKMNLRDWINQHRNEKVDMI